MTQPRNLDDLFPLSPMQHLMLLHALATTHQSALLNQVCYEIRGSLREAEFQRAWDALVARHPALRTAFLWDGLPQPLQAVRSRVALPFRIADLAGATEDERSRRLDELRREDLGAPMPLGKAPLMRCTLIQLPDEVWQFVWTVHHLVVDRWSHEVLFADLRALYAAELRGEQAHLSPAHGFREYIAWLASAPAPDAEQFWREALRGFTEPTLLADGGPRSLNAERLTTRRAIDPATTSALRARAAKWRTTLGALILSAVGMALANRFGRDDVLVGLTVSGRPPDLEGAETIVGSLVNNVPARIRIDRALPLSEWVRGVQRQQARSRAHEHVSPRDVRAWADVPHPLPLFDTLLLLNLSDAPEAAAWPDLEVRLVTATLDAAYPLILAAGAEGETLVISLVHDATFGDADPILEEIVDALTALAAAPPDAVVGSLIRHPERGPTVPGIVRQDSPIGATNGGALHVAATEDALLQIWREVLGTEAVGLDDDFFGLGGSSLQAMELFVRLERMLGRTVSISTLFSAGSVRGLMSELGRPVRHTGPLVKIRSSGTRPVLVAVPGIGGNVLGLAGLARALGPTQPFFALQSPGLDGHDAPLTSIEQIAECYVEQILPAVAQPFHLLGLCWGAAVAFEMSGRLREAGRAPSSLALVDPAALLRQSDTGGAGAEAAFLRRRLELYWDEFRGGDWRQRGQFLASKARRVAGVLARDAVRDESKAELGRFKVEAANRDAIVRYSPGRYAGRATVFLSSGRTFAAGEDPRLEWLSLIEPTPDVVYVEGEDSGDIIAPGHVDAFAAILRERLELAADLPMPS